MIIEQLYNTKIECSSHEVNIDTNTLKVIVTLEDFNKARVTGKQVTIKCDKGYFTKIEGATVQSLSGNSNKQATAKTDSNGQIILTHTANDWGLITFSCNNVKAQCVVTGFRKRVLYTGSLGTKITAHINGLNQSCVLVVDNIKKDFSGKFPLTKDKSKTIASFTFDGEYFPIAHVNSGCYRPDMVWGLYYSYDPNNSSHTYGDYPNKYFITVRSMIENANPTDTFTVSFRWNYGIPE